ncbi:MAG TPA: hypothetical protein VLI94_05310 [Solirubrobacterales bacterium]|nr:hypothetical protein [Solirubrobacterales bacterium]
MSRPRLDQDLARRLARSPKLGAALRRAARAVAAEAEPLTEPEHSVRVVDHGRGVRVVNTSPVAVREEWGSASQEPRAPLRRGVRAAGLRLDETR